MKSTALKLFMAAAAAALCASGAAQSGRAIMRVACDGDAVGAQVSVNGQVRGRCPVDVLVPPGTVTVRAFKQLSLEEERTFETSFELGPDAAKRVDIQLGPARLTEQGRVLQVERQRRAQAEAAAAAEEQRRRQEAAAAAEAERRRIAAESERQEVQRSAQQLLADYRKARIPAFAVPDCRTCPETFPVPRVALQKANVPRPTDPELATWFDEAQSQLAVLLTRREPWRPPGGLGDAPCAGADSAIALLVGLGDEFQSPPPRYAAVTEALRQGAPGHHFLVQERRVLWAAGQCQDGRLVGPVEVWVSALLVWGMPGRLVVQPVLANMRARFETGVPRALFTVVGFTTGVSTDTEFQRMLKDIPGVLIGEQTFAITYRAGGLPTDRPRGLLLQRIYEHPEFQKGQDGTFLRTMTANETACWQANRPQPCN